MKTFYFFHSLEKHEFEYFLDKVSSIHDIQDIWSVIEKYFHKIWQNNEGRTQKTAFAEALVFLHVFLQKGLGTIQDIQWVYAKNFLIYNDSLFECVGEQYSEITEKVLFVTSRDSWKNPFFLYLSLYFRDRVQLIKPNLQIVDSATDKLTCLSRIWRLRGQYVWDIVIPFLRNKNIPQIQCLLKFVQQKLGNHVVLKNNIWVEWKNVRALDLSDYTQGIDELYNSLKQDFFDIGISTQNNPYFTKYYNILREYRVYYTYSQIQGIHIYSVKNKENIPKQKENIFLTKNLSRQDLEIVWSYMNPDDFISHQKEVYDACMEIIPLLGVEVGVLELCQERAGEIRFIELNYLWGALMFPWRDQELMKDYYADMWNLWLSRDSSV